jgi:DivIVA domain-containing protein
MALTPDDVVTKQFQHVRFKEGFDPEEVDDFLDEIVVEWRKTIAENEELKAKLAAYESGEKPEAPAPAPVAEAPAPVEEAPAPAASGGAPAATSAGIIELAQRLHDEHVA